MEEVCLICLKQCPSKKHLDLKVISALNDIFQIQVCSFDSSIWNNIFDQNLFFQVTNEEKDSMILCLKCRATLLKFHQFYLETKKNYEQFQKSRESRFSETEIPVKEEYFDENAILEEFMPMKVETQNNSSCEEIESPRKSSPNKRRKSNKKRTYTQKDPYVCDLCGKSIRRFVDLRSHIEKTHLRLRKFQCHLCGDNFFASNNLKFHLTTHDKSRPRSQCKICGVQVLDLKKHFKTSHNDSNPVVCNICGKSLMNEMKLRYHVYKRHPPQGKFKCKICDKDFCNALYLKEHTYQKHIGGFLYTCDWCDFQTNYSKNMPTHQKLKHKDEYEARRRARPPMMSRVHEMKATLALQEQTNTS